MLEHLVVKVDYSNWHTNFYQLDIKRKIYQSVLYSGYIILSFKIKYYLEV